MPSYCPNCTLIYFDPPFAAPPSPLLCPIQNCQRAFQTTCPVCEGMKCTSRTLPTCIADCKNGYIPPLAIHASIGFEWQIAAVRLYDASGNLLPPKCIVYSLQDVDVESDGCELEFVSRPFFVRSRGRVGLSDFERNSWGQAIDSCGAFLRGRFSGKKLFKDIDKLQKSRHVKPSTGEAMSIMYSPPMDVLGRIQITFGLPLEKVGAFLCIRDAELAQLNKACADFWGEAYKENTESGGLYLLCAWYYTVFQEKRVSKDTNGPKQYLKFMVRNKFSDLYMSMRDEQKKAFDGLVKIVQKSALANCKMFPGGYYLEESDVASEHSPTYSEWLFSIINPVDGAKIFLSRIQVAAADFNMDGRCSDLMSPPPGFSTDGKNHMLYAMGRLDLQDAHRMVVIEDRGYGSSLGDRFESFKAKTIQYMECVLKAAGF